MTNSSPSPVTGQKARRQHSKEYKERAIALARDPEVGFRRAAKDLGLNESLLRKWADLSTNEGAEAFRGNGNRTVEGEQIAALQREVRILREERDILKKATEFFVKERK
jgi:transposase